MNMADIGSVVRYLPGRLGIATGTDTNNITHVWPFVCAGLVAEKGIAIAHSKAIPGTPPHSNVELGGGVFPQRIGTNGRVLLLQSGRRWVSTSQDVNEILGIKSRFNVSSTSLSKFEHGMLISPWH
jgi:hypothetical protein